MPLNIDQKNNYFSCEINEYSLYTRDCSYSMGGIKSILLFDTNNSIIFTEDLNQNIASITLQNNISFLKIDTYPFASKYSENFIRNEKGYFFDNTLEVSLDIRRFDKRLFLEKIKSKTLIFIIQDSGNRWWLIGEENGFKIDNFNESTGLGAQDFNGYNITFKGTSTFQSKEILQSVIDNLNPIADCTQWFGIIMQFYNLETIRYCTLDLKKLDYLG